MTNKTVHLTIRVPEQIDLVIEEVASGRKKSQFYIRALELGVQHLVQEQKQPSGFLSAAQILQELRSSPSATQALE